MKDSASLQAGALAAIYLLWLVSWLVLGADTFGPAHYNWDETLVAAAAAVAALNGARRASKPYPAFLILLGLGLACLAASWFAYDPTAFTRSSTLPHPERRAIPTICYALFVFVWVCGWGYLALKQWQRRPPSVLTGAVFAVLAFGLSVILVSFYYPEYAASLDTISGRLDAATSGLEFIALVVGLGCILLGEPAVVTWMLLATAMLVASDTAYAENDVPAAIEPVWMLGQFVLLAALLALPVATEASPSQSTTRCRRRRRTRPSAVRALGRSHPHFTRRRALVGGDRPDPDPPGVEVVFRRPVRRGPGGRAGVAHRSFRRGGAVPDGLYEEAASGAASE